jgi:hypothetical protein
MSKHKHHGGRPAGVAPVMNPPTVDVQPASRCPKCLSPERSDYIPGSKTVQVYAGILADGRRYNRVIRRRCKCLKCGQMRMDRAYEWAKN